MGNASYALDNFYLCELVQGLKDKQAIDPRYVVSAPMLYESKDRDGVVSLAAHATQTNLRLVRSDPVAQQA